MKISYDEAKRRVTLEKRKLDFADVSKLFEGPHFSLLDDRRNYGEERFLSFGELNGRSVVVVWTWRDETRRIISMRHAHDEEIEARRRALERLG